MAQSPAQKNQLTIAIIGAFAIIVAALIGKCNFSSVKESKTEGAKFTTIAGIVVDEATNANISLAEISLAGRNEQCSTDQNGNFKIVLKDSLSEVRIRVRKTKYLTYDKTFNLANENIFIQLKKDKSY